jgi:hypothetical protein
MIASLKQIDAIQKLNQVKNSKDRLLSIFALKNKLQTTKKITLVSSMTEPGNGSWIDLTFACTKVGLCKLNAAINATMRNVDFDDSIGVFKNSSSIYFEVPDNFKTKDAGVLYNCMCVRVIIRTCNFSSRTKVLNMFLENAKYFV